MPVFNELRISATVNKLWSLFSQNSIQVDVKRVFLKHRTKHLVVDSDLPRFKYFWLSLIVDFTLDAINEKLVTIFEAGRWKYLKGWKR